MLLERRNFLAGMLAAPVIIKTSGLIMPISKPKIIICVANSKCDTMYVNRSDNSWTEYSWLELSTRKDLKPTVDHWKKYNQYVFLFHSDVPDYMRKKNYA